MDSKKALVVISFGSTFDETRTHDIGGIEQALAAAFPAYDQYRAFTSVIIRKRLAERGIKIDDTETVLQKLVDAGYEEVASLSLLTKKTINWQRQLLPFRFLP